MGHDLCQSQSYGGLIAFARLAFSLSQKGRPDIQLTAACLRHTDENSSITNRKCHSNQLRKRASSGLFHDMSAVMLGSPRADPQLRRDNLVGMSIDQQSENLRLSWR